MEKLKKEEQIQDLMIVSGKEYSEVCRELETSKLSYEALMLSYRVNGRFPNEGE